MNKRLKKDKSLERDCDVCEATFEVMAKCGGYVGCLKRRGATKAAQRIIDEWKRKKACPEADESQRLFEIKEEVSRLLKTGSIEGGAEKIFKKGAEKTALEEDKQFFGRTDCVEAGCANVNAQSQEVEADGYGSADQNILPPLSIVEGEQEDLANEEEIEDKSCQCSEQASEEVSELGKFKNATELLRAYNALEGEFTKRCQRLKEVLTEVNSLREAQAAEGSTGAEDVPIAAARENLQEENGLSRKIEAAQEQIVAHAVRQNIEADRTKEAQTPQQDASARDLRERFLELMEDEDFLDSVIIDNPRVRAKIIEGYLRALEGIRPAKVIGGGNGRTALQPPQRPKTLEEAKKLAQLLMG